MNNKKSGSLYILAIAALLAVSGMSHSSESEKVTISESYYRVKWGHFDEFVDLFKKNHYPILKEMLKLGYIKSVTVDVPVYHASEDARWDIRITMVIPASGQLEREMAKSSKRLYPDQDALKKAEAQRFRLLLAHEDVEIRPVDTSNW